MSNDRSLTGAYAKVAGLIIATFSLITLAVVWAWPQPGDPSNGIDLVNALVIVCILIGLAVSLTIPWRHVHE